MGNRLICQSSLDSLMIIALADHTAGAAGSPTSSGAFKNGARPLSSSSRRSARWRGWRAPLSLIAHLGMQLRCCYSLLLASAHAHLPLTAAAAVWAVCAVGFPWWGCLPRLFASSTSSTWSGVRWRKGNKGRVRAMISDPVGAAEAEAVLDSNLPAAAPLPTNAPVLPAESLASVLNFLRYSDVRISLLAGKAIAVDAANHIETLSIVKPVGLDVPSARRFVNVSEVNILCVVKHHEEDWRGQVLCRDAVDRVIPFLTAFPKLKRVYVGGFRLHFRPSAFNRERSRRMDYNTYACLFPSDHATIFRSLIDSFCGALRARLLPRDLDIGGVLGRYKYRCPSELEDADNPCRLCRRICENFPFPTVFKQDCAFEYEEFEEDDDGNMLDRLITLVKDGDLCIKEEDRLKIMSTRPEAAAFYQSPAATKFFLRQFRLDYTWPYDNQEGDDFVARMKQLGAEIPDYIFYITEHEWKRITILVWGGLDPGIVPKEDLYKRSGCSIFRKQSSWVPMRPIWDVLTFYRLAAIGFPLDSADVLLVDRNSEPAIFS